MTTAHSPGAVVVGVDGSSPSRAALRWAVAHAPRLDTRVHAVAVWQEQVQFGPVPVFPEPDFEQHARAWLREALEELPDEIPTSDVVTHIDRGDPARILVDRALDARLLVLGNRGRGAFTGAVLGSVALRCAHHAQCPVVLVPAPTEQAG